MDVGSMGHWNARGYVIGCQNSGPVLGPILARSPVKGTIFFVHLSYTEIFP